MTEAKDSSGGSSSNPQVGVTGSTQAGQRKPKSFKSRMLTWLALFVLFLCVAFFVFRWIGTTTYRGKVQRVYEKGIEFRVEFADLDGQVHVIGNQDIKFPYFKLDTADLHASLNRLATTGDIVDLRVWGFRQSWFSMFPNAVDVSFVRSDAEQMEARAGLISDEVLEALRQKGALKGGAEVRPLVLDAVKRGMKIPGSDVDRSAPESEKQAP